MSETINTGWLKGNNGEKFAPKTLSSQVITSDGKLFEDEIKSQLENVMNTEGIVVNVQIGNWIEQSDGTFTNTITVSEVTAKDIYDVSLYGDFSEEQAHAYDFLVSSIDTLNGKVVLTASEKIDVAFSIILRGKVNLEDKNVYVSDLSATSIEYDNTKSNLDSTNMQNAMDEIATMVSGIVVNVSADSWDLQEDGTYKKIIPVEQITGNETLDVCLYPGDVHSEEQIVAFSELVTSIETGEGMIILTVVEEITVAFRIFLYGKISFNKNNLVALDGSIMEVKEISQEDYDNLPQSEKENGIYITDGDDLTAKNLEYDDTETQMGVSNVQDAIVKNANDISELNSNINILQESLQGKVATSENGSTTFGVPESSKFNGVISFTKPFNTIPTVLVSYIENVGLCRGTITVTEITKGGFSFEISNTGEHTVSITVSWNATADII